MTSFNVFLKRKRLSHNKSQQQIVSELNDFNDEFSGLNVVSYGRWERGIVVPSAKKMLLISSFFRCSLHDFVSDVCIQPTANQTKAFNRWIKLLDNIGHTVSSVGYNSVINGDYSMVAFSSNHKIDDNLNDSNVRKILNHNQKLLAINESISKNDTYITKKRRTLLQENNNLYIYVNFSPISGISSHATWTLHPLSTLEDMFNDSETIFTNINEGKLATANEPQFLFIHSFMLYTETWNSYMMSELTSYVLKNEDIESIVISVHIDEIVFELLSLFKSDIIGILNNKNFPGKTFVRFIRINRFDFLSQHGVLCMLKDNIGT